MKKSLCKAVTFLLACIFASAGCAGTKTLFDFEKKEELKNVESCNWREGFTKDFTFELSDQFQSNGKSCFKVLLPLSGCPGLKFDTGKLRDWSSFKNLKIYIENQGNEAVIAYVIAVDESNLKTFEESSPDDFPFFSKKIIKTGKNNINVDLKDFEAAEMKEIKKLIFCIPERSMDPLPLFIDNIRLE